MYLNIMGLIKRMLAVEIYVNILGPESQANRAALVVKNVWIPSLKIIVDSRTFLCVFGLS